MAKPKIDPRPQELFEVHFESRVLLEIDPRVFESALSKGWQRQFGFKWSADRKKAEGQVARYIAYNVLVNSMNLSEIDGFADLPDAYLKVLVNQTECAGRLHRGHPVTPCDSRSFSRSSLVKP